MVAARVADHGIDPNAFADEAMRGARRCSSLVGRADLVMPMWERLAVPHVTGRAPGRFQPLPHRHHQVGAALLVAGGPRRPGDADVGAAGSGLGPGP
ncbi:hypothetical protein MAHJHV29_48470 [Mycobacterium avium subsp. hominissuis]